jgi:hypothetical protein
MMAAMMNVSSPSSVTKIWIAQTHDSSAWEVVRHLCCRQGRVRAVRSSNEGGFCKYHEEAPRDSCKEAVGSCQVVTFTPHEASSLQTHSADIPVNLFVQTLEAGNNLQTIEARLKSHGRSGH